MREEDFNMKNFRRIVSVLLLLCVIISLLPSISFTRAATVNRRYELDTDGIDIGATYLIVNTKDTGTGNALRFNFSSNSNRSFANQTLTIQSDAKGIYIAPGFANEADCQFQFASNSITHGTYSVNLSESKFVNGAADYSLTFNNRGNGAYQISYQRLLRYYLRFNNNAWARSTSSSSVYLFKLVEEVVGYDITFSGNGFTSGSLPANASNLSYGATYTLPEPTNLRKDDGDDTWLFLCWNTEPDGSGIEYKPGEQITVTGDLSLYADWYQLNKHTVAMIAYLDGTPTDVVDISGLDKQFYAKLENDETAPYIPLHRTAEGTYTTKVETNGTYVIYSTLNGGAYEEVHGHKVVIFNQDGSTECMHYSVVYDTAGGTWGDNEEPIKEIHHFQEPVHAITNVPTLEGNEFQGWVDEDGNIYQPGHHITSSIDKPIRLSAMWEKTITVTVNVTIDHNSIDGGSNNEQTMHEFLFALVREENGVNMPVLEQLVNSGYTYDAVNNITTYTLVFSDLSQGIYHISGTKTHYESTTEHGQGTEQNHVINLNLKYNPNSFDLHFNVAVNAENDIEKALMPNAVNVKISYWGYNEQGQLGWHIITQQENKHAPSTVWIDENGNGTAFFPVWCYWTDNVRAYEYRLEVTSIVMPDGSLVPVSGDKGQYAVDGCGMYNATVSIKNGGRSPSENTTELSGSYYDGTAQNGTPLVTLEITPLNLRFDAGNGTINGQDSLTLNNIYRYPDLGLYTAVPHEEGKMFLGWADSDGNLVGNLEDALLEGNVTLYAKYGTNIPLSGTVTVDNCYLHNGEIVNVTEINLPKSVLVVLQRKVGDVYNDFDAQVITITYEENSNGTGSYFFEKLPNDGSEYRIQVLTLNYHDAYDNNGDDTYAEEECLVLLDANTTAATVNAYLDFVPASYQQNIKVDSSRIHADLRPTGADVRILYRDLGDVHNYQVISQHAGAALKVDFIGTTATGSENVWNWHVNGTVYEYQLQVPTLYGNNVPGAYDKDGTAYTADSPFTIVYGVPSSYLKSSTILQATLVPKEYPIILDLNLQGDTNAQVKGLEHLLVDNPDGTYKYAFMHTWSFTEHFTAYPYREGYVFKGWTIEDNDVYVENDEIHVGNTLDHSVTLKAEWDKLSGTDYTIRYLEMNTEKVLQAATTVSGSTVGTEIVVANAAPAIKDYTYAGASINGEYFDKYDDPVMTVTNDPATNQLVIYYLPDNGFTDPVESNLEINKTAVLENNGTYTITLDTYTKDNPITTLIEQNTPLDIVLVLDQSGSLADNNYLNALKESVGNFIDSVAYHGRKNKVDHRIAIVGFAGNSSDAHSSGTVTATGGKETDSWINTGVFDSNGEYHLYNVNGFNYTALANTNNMTTNGVYYTKIVEDGKDKYLLLTYHSTYYHLLTEEDARVAALQGETVYGYVFDDNGQGSFTEVTRNSSGLWLYGNKKLYSEDEFFTYHTDVWTHRNGTGHREIHAYGTGASYTPIDGHEGVYTRTETTSNTFQHSIYEDALVPVSVGANGSGNTNPGLENAYKNLGADGATRASYGMEMANAVLAANPLGEDDDRIRMVLMFTDGEPGYMGFDDSHETTSGQQYYAQAVVEANAAIQHAYTAKHVHNAYVYSIGLYKSTGVDEDSEVAYYMNALSSNYPNAQRMADAKTLTLANDTLVNNGNYYALVNGVYYEIMYGRVKVGNSTTNRWYYQINGTNYNVSTSSSVKPSNGTISGLNYKVYKGTGYAATENSGYYTTTDSADQLQDYFESALRDITTKISTEIVLKDDTILRDIMNQGLVLTDGTVITVYTQEGNYDLNTGKIIWATDAMGNPLLDEKVHLTLSSGETSIKDPVSGVSINVYNLDAENPTDINSPNYAPHAVDISGYNFSEWYISANHTRGHKMVVKITRAEARDDVDWGRSTSTNNDRSGLWLPAGEAGERQLLLAFDQPTTVFVHRTYVLDYGKEFTLSDWYFDDAVDKNATPIHIDCDINSGMNWFDPLNPNTTNVIDGAYGNTKYGNVQIKDGQVTYRPTTTNWGGYDQFYIFGNTWEELVVSQDANQNGNLWHKVTVLPANNIYYEDSFITTNDSTQNGIEGFTFTGAWSIVKDNAGGNTETPENAEDATYGDVHGWTDSLSDDITFTDGSAHVTGLNGEMGAQANLTFTGTGIEVYTRTNSTSGMVVAVLSYKETDANGNEVTKVYKSVAMDNLAMSGDYYHIPTIAFKKLPYRTYNLQLIATATTASTNYKRFEYYIDGVRILNPLGNDVDTFQSETVKDAYGLETYSVFTSVRDILLDYEDFNKDLSDGTDNKMGAVFIDWIQDGQGNDGDSSGTGVPTYQIGTFEKYGPKNEVYLSPGQAIVLKVAEGNNYFVGLKSLNGKEVIANVSGITQANPTAISLTHTTDMYYQVKPIEGYIVIQNGGAEGTILSITNLRTTNSLGPVSDGGVLDLTQAEAVEVISDYTAYVLARQEELENEPPAAPETEIPSADEQAQANISLANSLFTSVRQWLVPNEEEVGLA